MGNRDHIKHVLRHYIRLPWEATGLKWDWDNDSEVDALADAIIDAAVAEALEQMRAATLDRPHHLAGPRPLAGPPKARRDACPRPLLADAVLGKPDADPAAPGGGVAWRIVDRDNLPEPQWMLVTNSLASQDAHGEMSHLWLTRMLHRAYDGSGNIESIVAFSEPDGRMIENVTHWRPALPTKE